MVGFIGKVKKKNEEYATDWSQIKWNMNSGITLIDN